MTEQFRSSKDSLSAAQLSVTSGFSLRRYWRESPWRPALYRCRNRRGQHRGFRWRDEGDFTEQVLHPGLLPTIPNWLAVTAGVSASYCAYARAPFPASPVGYRNPALDEIIQRPGFQCLYRRLDAEYAVIISTGIAGFNALISFSWQCRPSPPFAHRKAQDQKLAPHLLQRLSPAVRQRDVIAPARSKACKIVQWLMSSSTTRIRYYRASSLWVLTRNIDRKTEVNVAPFPSWLAT